MKAKKIIIPVSIIAGIAVIGVAVAALGNAASGVTYADTIKIQQKTLENKISVSGTVKSAEVTKVYSRLTYPVETINVSVGDAVKKGDVLCTISTEDLQQQILQQQASVESSGISSEYSLSSAEEKYSTALEAYENGENAAVMNAERAVKQAEQALENAKRDEKLGLDTSLPDAMDNAGTQADTAKKAYDKSVEAYEKAVAELEPKNHPASVKKIYDDLEEAKDLLEEASHPEIAEIMEAELRYDKAKYAYDNMLMYASSYGEAAADEITTEYTAAKSALAAAYAKYDKDNLKEQIKALEIQYATALENLETAKDAAETAMNNAKLTYDSASKTVDRTGKSNETTKENYGIAVKNAEDALAEAKKNYELAVQQAESELAALKKNAEQQRTLSGLNDPQVIMLQNLKDKLEFAVVVAPCDGVITAVNAEEGVTAGGPLFVIEDLSSLMVSASVGEYDIPYIAEGMEATVRCDAVQGSEYTGKVSSVAPTGMPGNTGTSYSIEADIDGEDGKILVGMNAKVSIISDKRENALTITYDALSTDEDGNDVIYIAEKDENGVYHAKMIQVEIGLENDYEIEIISDSISAGMYVLTNTTMLSDGDVVLINEEDTAAETEVTE